MRRRSCPLPLREKAAEPKTPTKERGGRKAEQGEGEIRNGEGAAFMQFGPLTLEGMARLARVLAPMLRAGDVIALRGEIGAGKTTFARLLIRTLMGNAAEEAPSPAFALQVTYDTPRLRVSHFDLYRLRSETEVEELGLYDAIGAGLVIIEWPERAGGALPPETIEITFSETGDPETRNLAFAMQGATLARLARFKPIFDFLGRSAWRDAAIEHLRGDASDRRYYRLRRGPETALLMDWPRQSDGPPIRDGKPYSQIAHLAEDVAPFVALASALRETGLGAPAIYEQDLEAGLLVIEDFGDAVFQNLARKGHDLAPLWRLAADALINLRRFTPPAAIPVGGRHYHLRPYDAGALGIETELLLDWFLPDANGAQAPEAARREFTEIWSRHFHWLAQQRHETAWVLRDYHSPNLILREAREGGNRLGVIDFQDALIGHRAYDLVSLLQDARVTVPEALEAALFSYYCEEAARHDPAFDKENFRRAYATLGAQRATKILGIFVRLHKRDGKCAYRQHIPRVAHYLRRNLEHPALTDLKAWYEREAPSLAKMASQSFAEDVTIVQDRM